MAYKQRTEIIELRPNEEITDYRYCLDVAILNLDIARWIYSTSEQRLPAQIVSSGLLREAEVACASVAHMLFEKWIEVTDEA